MYSLRYAERLSWLRLYGLTDRGEIPLRDERDFAPFDEARLIVALQRLQSARGCGCTIAGKPGACPSARLCARCAYTP
jgi:hypothetical protein